MPALTDLTGLKVGRLTVQWPVGRGPNQKVQWLSLCDCGKLVIHLAHSLSHALRKGRTASCGCADNERLREYGLQAAIRQELGGDLAAFRLVVREYRKNAKNRGLTFDLSDQDLRKVLSERCHYCGTPPSSSRKAKAGYPFLCNGLDRIDNSAGYSLENIVACCRRCNWAKGESTQAEFYTWLDQLITHRKKSDV